VKLLLAFSDQAQALLDPQLKLQGYLETYLIIQFMVTDG
jgi:hypothetical protein